MGPAGAPKTEKAPKLTPVRLVELHKVYVFPQADLAIVKAPIQAKTWFELAPSCPEEGTPIHYARNPYNHGGPSALAARVQAPTVRQQANGYHTWWFDADLPVISGDSGGPACDEAGRLLGCGSTANIWRYFSSRTTANRWTSVIGAPAAEILQLVSLHRALENAQQKL
jgi:hypothetical protein